MLTLLGVVLLRLVITGEYQNYVRPGLGVYLAAAGVFFTVVGVLGAYHDFGRPSAPSVRTHGPGALDYGHSDAHGVSWLLAVPVLVMLLVPPPPLGSFAAGRGGAAAPLPPSRMVYPALPATVALTVRDYAMRAVWDHGRTLAGHRVTLTGFVAAAPDDAWYLTRMHVWCCAADASPAKVQVVGASRRYPTNQWVTVVGSWIASDPNDLAGEVARIRAESISAVARPGDPYE